MKIRREWERILLLIINRRRDPGAEQRWQIRSQSHGQQEGPNGGLWIMGFACGFKKDFAKQGSRELQRTCCELSVIRLLGICLCFSSRKQDVFNCNGQVSVSKPEPSGLGFCGCLVCSELLCISVVMVKHWALATKGRRGLAATSRSQGRHSNGSEAETTEEQGNAIYWFSP